jgi:AraC-like DNA-binding protein
VTSFRIGPSGQVLLADLGISVPNVLSRAALPEALFAERTVALTVSEYYDFWRALGDEAADPLLPIRIGKAISVETFDPPLFAAFCSPTLTVAVSRIAKYKKLIGPMRLVVGSSIDAITIETLWPEDSHPPDILLITELVFWVALARMATRAEIRPLRVNAPVQFAPDQADAYRDFFGVPIDHATVPSITFSASDAERPFLTANDQMWDCFEPGLRRQLTDLDTGAATVDLVRSALLRQLPAGSATMRSVARELAISTRTLQRRLQVEGASFQSVLRDTREALARHYLARPDLTAGQISYLLGYDDTNSFYRAFHSWTGQTPSSAADSGV